MNLRIYAAIFISYVAFVSSVGATDTYLSIDFYPVTKDAYNGNTPINGVLRIPRASILGSSKCFPGLAASYDEKAEACPAEWAAFYEKCKAQISEAVRRAPSFDDAPPSIQIARLNNGGGAVMAIRSFFGGSGGGRYDWSLFLLRWQKTEQANCPWDPFLSGVEVVPGGNVWVETFCKNETAEACAERIFYPKGNAFRLEFGVKGTHLLPIPAGAKIPTQDGL